MTPPRPPLPCEEADECAVATGAAVRKEDVGVYGVADALRKIWPLLVLLAAVAGFALNAEMRNANSSQNDEIAARYVSQVQFNERMSSIQAAMNSMAEEQRHQRALLEDALKKGR